MTFAAQTAWEVAWVDYEDDIQLAVFATEDEARTACARVRQEADEEVEWNVIARPLIHADRELGPSAKWQVSTDIMHGGTFVFMVPPCGEETWWAFDDGEKSAELYAPSESAAVEKFRNHNWTLSLSVATARDEIGGE